MKLADAGLRKQPFPPDGKTQILVAYDAQKAAIKFLNEIRFSDSGLGLLYGPPLSGKTSVIRQFRTMLPAEYAVAVVDGAGRDATALLKQSLAQYGYDLGLGSANECFSMLRVFAQQQAAGGQAPLFIVDDAQSLSPFSLETLCELAELCVGGKSALKIVLAGDESMLPIVRAPAMGPVSSRVTGTCLLKPLTLEETARYVHEKLAGAGSRNPLAVMPLATCERLHRLSGGWPGLIDRLALLALSKAGGCTVRVDDVPQKPAMPQAPGSSGPVPQLILTCRRKTLARLPLDKPRLMIGRNELCDLRIFSDRVSRHHAVVFRNGSATIIVDLKSRNGTFVNGRRISKQVLVNNDIVSMGDHRIKFMDAAARHRTSLEGAGWDDTTIAESIADFRNFIAREKIRRIAG